MARHVCLLANGNSWRDAPFGDPSVEMWAVGSGHHLFPRVDRYFELHREDQIDASFFEWAPTESVPIYMIDVDPRWPSSVRFPQASVLAVCAKRYFTCTVAWMIGLALAEGVETLSLYGIELSAASEYGFERPCAEYWLGVFEGRGGSVHISPKSTLCTAAELYGYRQPTGHGYLYVPQNISPTACRIGNIVVQGMTFVDSQGHLAAVAAQGHDYGEGREGRALAAAAALTDGRGHHQDRAGGEAEP